MSSCQIAETAGSADRMARRPFVQALIFLAEAPAVRSDYTGMLSSVTASLRHFAKFGSAAVWPMAD